MFHFFVAQLFFFVVATSQLKISIIVVSRCPAPSCMFFFYILLLISFWLVDFLSLSRHSAKCALFEIFRHRMTKKFIYNGTIKFTGVEPSAAQQHISKSTAQFPLLPSQKLERDAHTHYDFSWLKSSIGTMNFLAEFAREIELFVLLVIVCGDVVASSVGMFCLIYCFCWE